jgi:hypothetical protein
MYVFLALSWLWWTITSTVSALLLVGVMSVILIFLKNIIKEIWPRQRHVTPSRHISNDDFDTERELFQAKTHPMFKEIRYPQSKVYKECVVCYKTRTGYQCPTCAHGWTCRQCCEEWTFNNPWRVIWPCCNLPRDVGGSRECIIRRFAVSNTTDLSYHDAQPHIEEFQNYIISRSFHTGFK